MSSRTFIVILALVVIVISVCHTNMSEAQIVLDGLISYWTFDEEDREDRIVNDTVGINHGTIMGNPEVVDGWIGDALMFDGAADGVDCGQDESLNLGKEDFTLEAWFSGGAQTSSWPCIFRKGNALCDGCPPGYAIYWAGNNWSLAVDGSDQIGDQDRVSVASGPYMDEEWHHIVGTRDKDNMHLYLDGVLVNSGLNNDRNVNVGTGLALSFDTSFNGALDEVKIYSRALSEDEVLRNFKAVSREISVEPANKLAVTWGSIKRH
ncbi:LamG domain-containing protein [Candidatus Poribacteria bacterium]